MGIPAHLLALESQLDGVSVETVSEPAGFPVAAMVGALKAFQWSAADEMARSLFDAATLDEERAFVLHCAVACAEMESDSGRREAWLKRWAEVRNPESNLYCRYVRVYQSALTAFFRGYLSEAEFRFASALETAERAGFRNGVMRSYFHLALVFRDRMDFDKATEYLLRAMEVAVFLGAARYMQRIREQMAGLDESRPRSLESGSSVGGFAVEIERALRAGDIAGARLALARAETFRREKKIGRRVASFHAYLPLIHFVRGRERMGRRALAWIEDPILLVKILELKERLCSLTDTEQEQLAGLRALHGLSSSLRAHPLERERSEIFGKKISDLESESVRTLFVAFLSSKDRALTKEEICERVWRLRYDPVVHDGKIYKLIHQARGEFPGREVFVNSYGCYRLNA